MPPRAARRRFAHRPARPARRCALHGKAQGTLALAQQAQALLQHSQHAALVVDTEGHARWVNATLAAAAGVSAQRAGSPAPWSLLLGNGSTPQQRAQLARAVRGGAPTRVLAVHQAAGRPPVQLDLDVQPWHDAAGALVGFLAVGANVSTDRARERRLRLLIDNAAAGIVVQDGHGNVVDCNPEAERLLGQTRDQLLGRAWLDPRWRTLARDGSTLLGHELPAIHTLRHREPLRNQLVGVDIPQSRSDQLLRRWLRVNTQLIIDGQTNQRSVLSSFTDATEQEDHQAELQGERERLAAALQNSQEQVQQRRQLEQQLLNAARTDRLTGLPNRTLLMERLEHAVRALRADATRGFALFFLDFDRFKLVNDSLGHEAGDLLLREISLRLRRTLRSGDVVGPEHDGNLVARFGGDEFVVLLNDAARVDEAHRVSQRLLEAFAAPYFIKGKEIHSSVSIGIVMGTADTDAEALLRNADTAMYEAKRTGRGRAVFFDLGMHTRLARALTIEEALRHAVQRRQLSLVYQPIVDLETGLIVSTEALLRWQHPELGMVSPAEFIPVAEESGLILDIGEWVLREACRQWSRWQQQHPAHAPATISVNLSRVQMGRPERLLERVEEALAENRIPKGHLQLEVTEREVMHEPAEMRALMQRLRGLGVRLAMDDFGTGTSSLGCLRDYPFDVVKIDKSFLAGLHNSPDVMAVMHATVTVIENLGMTSVAEGVETPAQVALLQSIGCRFAQGYLFARPMPADALAALLPTPLVASDAAALAQVQDASAPTRHDAGATRAA
ncbi:PAS domain S-box/diguanylate cyclase (GGDEF) domain-containing protein [Burkholderiales bacterium JOSHI_001]|nr:PAS domain S-box/diguanylate cyclase (GGDEF) domain-containing protein [Burkholderiales bacterium JOSHI_001]